MGAYIDSSLLSDDLLPKIQELCKQDVTMEDVRKYPLEYIEELFGGPLHTDFDFSTGDPNNWDPEPMIGIPYEKMGEDETKRQFRERVKKGIKDALGIDVEVSHIEACWEDR